MSKRYGRNQKRRDRQRIADLETEKRTLILWERAKAREIESLFGRLKRQEEHVAEIADTINGVVEYSALLPPKKVSGEPWTDNPRRHSLVPKRRFEISRFDEPPTIENVSIDILELDLWLLEATLGQDTYHFERFVHVLAPGPSGARYRISESAYRQFLRGGAPGIERELCRMITGVLRATGAS